MNRSSVAKRYFGPSNKSVKRVAVFHHASQDLGRRCGRVTGHDRTSVNGAETALRALQEVGEGCGNSSEDVAETQSWVSQRFGWVERNGLTGEGTLLRGSRHWYHAWFIVAQALREIRVT